MYRLLSRYAGNQNLMFCLLYQNSVNTWRIIEVEVDFKFLCSSMPAMNRFGNRSITV